jgi:prevent-host-death family protein
VVDKWAKMAKSDEGRFDERQAMQSMSAKDAKYGFGRLIDLARSEPVVVEKHGRPVVVVLAVEEYERLRDGTQSAGSRSTRAPAKSSAKRRGVERV